MTTSTSHLPFNSTLVVRPDGVFKYSKEFVLNISWVKPLAYFKFLIAEFISHLLRSSFLTLAPENILLILVTLDTFHFDTSKFEKANL